MVLGCRLKENGECSQICIDRLIKAKQIYDEYYLYNIEPPTIILSGGAAHTDKNECDGMKEYLIKLGVTDGNVLLERKSINTKENLINSFNLIKRTPDCGVVVITSDFHVSRVYLIAKQNKLKCMVIGSETTDNSLDKWISEIVKIVEYYLSKIIYISYFFLLLSYFINF